MHERTNMLERSVERMRELTNTMLDVSRLTQHRIELTPAEIDLHELTAHVIDRLRPLLESSGSSLTLHAPVPLVGNWDRLRLDQIVTNLVSNAIKYGDAKPIEVTVEARSGTAVVQVTDHGIGIAPADQLRIFERFERAVPTRHYGGFGLGLWIARQLVEALGGTIRVDSTLGAGATFTVTLPL
jgi:signal transduction histidine kinase